MFVTLEFRNHNGLPVRQEDAGPPYISQETALKHLQTLDLANELLRAQEDNNNIVSVRATLLDGKKGIDIANRVYPRIRQKTLQTSRNEPQA